MLVRFTGIVFSEETDLAMNEWYRRVAESHKRYAKCMTSETPTPNSYLWSFLSSDMVRHTLGFPETIQHLAAAATGPLLAQQSPSISSKWIDWSKPLKTQTLRVIIYKTDKINFSMLEYSYATTSSA